MLPNLIVIGAMKSGTSSLHRYLGTHPEIFMSAQKELNYFIEERNWSKGRAWYESNFRSDAKIRGETSPNYTGYPRVKGVPQRMHALVPDCKLIYLLRDPVDRFVSQYVHSCLEGAESRSFKEVAEDTDGIYYSRSKYHLQMKVFLECYSPDQILVVSSERLSADRASTMQEVFRWLGVDPDFSSPLWDQTFYVSRQRRRLNRAGRLAISVGSRLGKLVPPALKRRVVPLVQSSRLLSSPVQRPEISVEQRQFIASHLAEDVEMLRAATGKSFAEWSL